MPDSPTVAPGVKRNTVRAGTMDPFKKDAADQASERAKGEAKREAKAPAGGRRIGTDLSAVGAVNTIRDRQYRESKAIDDAS